MTQAVKGRRFSRSVEQLPEPNRFWIAFAPHLWRSSDLAWTDLARGGLGGMEADPLAPLPELKKAERGDLFYLPPVADSLSEDRDELANTLLGAGTPVLVQLRPGQVCGLPGVTIVYDLLQALLDGGVAGMAGLPPGSSAVWPLIAGLSDPPELCDEACALMSEGGVRVVQPLALELTPSSRRRLAEGRGDDVFDALFHGRVPSEREFVGIARKYGLEVFLPRPESGSTLRQRNNRAIAAQLALVGEIWLRLGRPMGQGQAYLRAARGAERTHHDLVALAREENLSVMDWLDATNVQLIEEIVRESRCELLPALLGEYQAIGEE